MLQQRGGQAVDSARGSDGVAHHLAKARSHRVAGRFDQARKSLRLVLDADAGHAEAHHELGVMASRTAPDEAVPHFVSALRSGSDRPAYWLALATALIAAGRLPDARSILERYKTRDFGPDAQAQTETFVTWAFSRAQTRYDAEAFREAEALLDLVILFDETHARATYLAGAIAAQTNRLDLAFDLMSIAIYREPANPIFFSGLGSLLTLRGDHDGAVSALEKALTLDPDLSVAHANLAAVRQRCFRHGEALHHAERAIDIDPGNAGAHSNRGSALMSMGRIDEAIAAFDRALTIDPGKVFAASNRLFAKLYAAGARPEDYAADAMAFGRRFADPLLRRRPMANDRDPERRLRVGFVSGDLCGHALVRFFEPFLHAFDRAGFEALAYMTHPREDEVSARLRLLFDGWHNISGLDDDEAADRIESDRIDVLVDLAGHSGGNRLLVFARKPAPVQVTWIGHPGTTGLSAMDYRLTDPVTDPPGHAEPLHAERLWRLPRVTATYAGPDDLPPVRAQAPCEDAGYVTFGFLNRLTKVSDGTLATWAQILAAVPDARLFMVVASVDAPEIRAEVEARLAGAGLPLDRIILHPRVSSGYYELYDKVDIALDPYPYNGGTTSYDTLSMGVPLVSLRGAHAAARTGVTVLTAVGLTELIADSPEAYVRIAQGLACDRDRLRAVREGLRQRLEASALMDHDGLAADVGAAFRGMWRRWLAEEGS